MSLPNINSTLQSITNNLSQVISATNALGTTLGPHIKTIGAVYLGTVNVTSGALSDTTILAAKASSYRSFEFVFKNIVGTNANVDYDFQWHSGGTFQTTSYSSSVMFTAGVTTQVESSIVGIVVGFTDSGSVPGSSGSAKVSTLNGTTFKLMTCNAASSVNGNLYTISSVGVWNSSNAVDGFRVVASDAGALVSGSVDIYGIL